jgi:alanine racemase
VPFLRRLSSLPHVHFEGLWTHFATADEADKAYARQQLAEYQQVVRRLDEAGLRPRYRHVANSAAALEMPEAHLDLVRCGIATYGLYPSAAVGREVPLRPALALKARVGRVSCHPAGTSVGYGRTYVADRDFVAALVPGGYADGLRRSLSNLGQVLIHGHRARILGRVSMDQVVVDVTDIPGVEVGDEVVVLGQQGEERITAEDLATWTGTINYEVVTAVAARVPRLYLREGRVVATETLVDQ